MRASLALLSASLASCAPSTPPGLDAGPIDPTWSSIYDRVIVEHCAVELCHIPTDPAGALDMSTRDLAYANLVGVDAMGDHCAWSGMRVAPGYPERSLLVHKLDGSPLSNGLPLCGERMPYMRAALPPQWIEQIRAWIANGAHPN